MGEHCLYKGNLSIHILAVIHDFIDQCYDISLCGGRNFSDLTLF